MSSNSTRTVPQADRIAKRRSQILKAASRTMTKKGYYGTSMQSVADEAGMSVGLIYQYYANKDEVLEAVIIDILGDFDRAVPPAMAAAGDGPEARIRAGFAAFVRIIDRKRAASLLAYRESQTLAPAAARTIMRLETETIDPFRQAVDDGIELGLFRPVSARLVAHNVKMLAHGWALKHWDLVSHVTLDEYIDQELDILFAGLRSGGR